MYIKAVIISNFKSYHGCTIIQDFRPYHNVLFGENGTGKSNFLRAIAFLMNFEDKLVTKRKIQILLSPRTTEGFIEILYSECHIPSGSEIMIRKEFSLITGVRFYVNQTRMDQRKVKSLFEIYGIYSTDLFSMLSPLKVHEFMKFSSKDMLEHVLRNMGVSVQETYKFLEKIFFVFEGQKEKIDYLFDLLKGVSIKENEQNLLCAKKYKLKKKIILANIFKRRIIEYRLNKRKLEENLNLLSEGPKIDTSSSTISPLKLSHSHVQNKWYIEKDLLDDLINEECQLIQNKEKVYFLVHSLIKEIEIIKKKTNGTSEPKRLFYIENKITTMSKELEMMENQLKLKRDIFTKIELQKTSKEEIRLNLLCKLERTKDYPNKEIRNAHLQIEISSLNEKIKITEEEVNILKIRCNDLKKNKSYIQEKIKKLKTELEQQESLRKNIIHKKEQLHNFQDKMSDLRRRERVIEDEISESFQAIQEKGLQIKKKIGSATVIGAENILTIIKASESSENHRWLYDSYFGMVIDNFECNEELNIAIESAIGNRLFAHVVRNITTGTELLSQMSSLQLPGEACFMPIDNLLEFSYDYPTFNDAQPILNVMKFKPDFARVMTFLFGHVIICRNINVAVDFMKNYSGFTCVTLEGDKISKSVMNGGYFHKSKCLRTLYLEIKLWHNKHSLKTSELEKLKNLMITLDSDINSVLSSVQLLKLKYTNTDMKQYLHKMNKEEKKCEEEFLNINEQIRKKRIVIQQLIATKKMITEEIHEDFEPLNDEISIKLIKINQEIKDASKLLNEKNLELIGLESKIFKLKNNLNLQKKLKDLENLDTSEIKQFMKKMEEYKVKERIIDNRLNMVRNKIEDARKSLAETYSQKLKLEKEMNECIELESLAMNDSRREKIKGKLLLLSKKLNHYEILLDNIKYPSGIPTLHLTMPELCSQLKKMKENLETALIRCSNTGKTKKKTLKLYNKVEYMQNYFSKNYIIYAELVEWFHSHVYESLNSISDVFSDFFRYFTGQGEANLFLDCDGSSKNWPALENMNGLQICVQLPASDECWDMLSLSSNQKVLVSLALVFSILKVCPVTICTFDEIDRSLSDKEKKLICLKMSELDGLQIFSASHSREWIKLGKSIYHVTFKNMMSNIKEVSEREAEEIISKQGTMRSKQELYSTLSVSGSLSTP